VPKREAGYFDRVYMKSLENYWIADIENTDTPFLAVYPDIVNRNIQRLISLFPGKSQIRPHVKTHKCPQVVALLLEAGITKFKCATIAEAEMLASAGARDILLAYQPVGPKINRFIQLMITFPDCDFSCLVDNETSARQIADQALKAQMTVCLWIDLNVGMNRTGIKPGHDAKKLVEFCSDLPAVKVIGLHAYDGHITDPDEGIRLAQAQKGFLEVSSLAEKLTDLGYTYLRIAAGSTPTISFYARQSGVECSPGTFIYWDQHYQELFPELGFQNAALVISRVISKPDTETVCLDLGYKAISSESPADQRVEMPQYPHGKVLSQSEEHLLVHVGPVQPQIGEVVYGFPFHIGRTCNLYEDCAVVEEHQITKKWPHTARKR